MSGPTPTGAGDASTAAPTNVLKEWAVIVHALLEGEQIVDLRKGGLREQGRHFGLPTRRAWLYPTTEHQKAELLSPAYRHWIDLAPGSPVGHAITVSGWVDIVAVATLSEAEQLAAIEGKVIWTPQYAASRLNWKHRDPLWVLVTRAYRLEEPIVVPWSDRYGGCTSWVALDGLPEDPASLPSEPALSDTAFEARWKGVRGALEGAGVAIDDVAAG